MDNQNRDKNMPPKSNVPGRDNQPGAGRDLNRDRDHSAQRPGTGAGAGKKIEKDSRLPNK